ncbi:hypothetical protein FKM82_018217 [Ascaphus truei]
MVRYALTVSLINICLLSTLGSGTQLEDFLYFCQGLSALPSSCLHSASQQSHNTQQ